MTSECKSTHLNCFQVPATAPIFRVLFIWTALPVYLQNGVKGHPQSWTLSGSWKNIFLHRSGVSVKIASWRALTSLKQLLLLRDPTESLAFISVSLCWSGVEICAHFSPADWSVRPKVGHTLRSTHNMAAKDEYFQVILMWNAIIAWKLCDFWLGRPHQIQRDSVFVVEIAFLVLKGAQTRAERVVNPVCGERTTSRFKWQKSSTCRRFWISPRRVKASTMAGFGNNTVSFWECDSMSILLDSWELGLEEQLKVCTYL